MRSGEEQKCPGKSISTLKKIGSSPIFEKTVQSASINFLIGAGCSCPAISPLGDVSQSFSLALSKMIRHADHDYVRLEEQRAFQQE